MYNLGVLSFQSFHVKFEAILKIQKPRICPLLILNSHFKMEVEFENGFKRNVVGFEKLNNFCFWRFSSSYLILKVILKIQRKRWRKETIAVLQQCNIS
jgi:hypothetical protein